LAYSEKASISKPAETLSEDQVTVVLQWRNRAGELFLFRVFYGGERKGRVGVCACDAVFDSPGRSLSA